MVFAVHVEQWTSSTPSVGSSGCKEVEPVHMCFVDLEKVFDCVPREVLWGVLWNYGVLGSLIQAVRSLYDLEFGPEMSFLCRVAGLSLRDRVWSSAIGEELGVEPILLRIERSQLRWWTTCLVRC